MEIEAANIDLSNLSLTGENKFDLKLDISVADEKFLYLDQNKANINLNNLSELGEQRFNAKVDKVEGKQLSTEDFTTEEKNKLAQLDNYVRVSNDVNSITSIDTTDGAVTTGITINPNTQSIVLGNDDTQLIDSMAQTAIMRSVRNANQVVVSNDGINITSTNSAGMNISSPTLRYNDNSPNTEGGLMVLDKLSSPFPIIDDGQFETVRVGADREIKTLEEFFEYIRSKNAGSHGIKGIFDDEEFTAPSAASEVFENYKISLAGSGNKATVIKGLDLYMKHSCCNIENITFDQCLIRSWYCSSVIITDCTAIHTRFRAGYCSSMEIINSTCTSAAAVGISIYAYKLSHITLSDVILTADEKTGNWGIYSDHNSSIYATNLKISNFHYAVLAGNNSSIELKDNCSINEYEVAFVCNSFGFIRAETANVSIDNSGTETEANIPVNTLVATNQYGLIMR